MELQGDPGISVFAGDEQVSHAFPSCDDSIAANPFVTTSLAANVSTGIQVTDDQRLSQSCSADSRPEVVETLRPILQSLLENR